MGKIQNTDLLRRPGHEAELRPHRPLPRERREWNELSHPAAAPAVRARTRKTSGPRAGFKSSLAENPQLLAISKVVLKIPLK